MSTNPFDDLDLEEPAASGEPLVVPQELVEAISAHDDDDWSGCDSGDNMFVHMTPEQWKLLEERMATWREWEDAPGDGPEYPL